jgi:hypothetical protein
MAKTGAGGVRQAVLPKDHEKGSGKENKKKKPLAGSFILLRGSA